MVFSRKEREGFSVSGPATIYVLKDRHGATRFRVEAKPEVEITLLRKLLEPVEVTEKPAPEEECC